jgi:hypothetical protein
MKTTVVPWKKINKISKTLARLRKKGGKMQITNIKNERIDIKLKKQDTTIHVPIGVG